MNNYKFIINPTTGRKVNINGKLGQQILNNYTQLSQTGGHNKPCALNSNGTRCVKSKTWDKKNCKLSDKKNCAMTLSAKKVTKAKRSSKTKKSAKKPVKKVDFYNESWVNEANYGSKKSLKVLKYRREMIDEIFEIYNEYKLIDNSIVSPEDWRDPPQWCYEEQLINNLKFYKEEFADALDIHSNSKYNHITLGAQDLVKIVNDYYTPYNDTSPVNIEKVFQALRQIRYDPDYTSIFTGKAINFKNTAQRFFDRNYFPDDTLEELENSSYIQQEALKDQIYDKIGEEGFWSDIMEK